ncbi:cytochrome-c peroxidase [Thiovibrio sp. JS02]
MMKKIIYASALLGATVLAGSALAAQQGGGAQQSDIVRLGHMMYMDVDFSYNSTQSCQTCHHPRSGFADPTNSQDPFHTVVSTGADGVSKGGRNAPTSSYAGYSPALHKDPATGAWVGGMFWDGRATGLTENLADPLAEQAQGPPLNPVEMNMPSAAAVVEAVRNSRYADLFIQVFGANAFANVSEAYDNIARAIAAFERSNSVQRFASSYDARTLTAQESNGLALFEANCSKCHATTPANGAPVALFTNYSYENIGVPANPLLAGNPTDLGLGGFLGDAAENGKFKVPTLRNVALTAPYGHNGYFPTLKDVVSFHNSRDTGNWPAPEVVENLNTTDVGNMGLSDAEVDDIVAFLAALSDR